MNAARAVLVRTRDSLRNPASRAAAVGCGRVVVGTRWKGTVPKRNPNRPLLPIGGIAMVALAILIADDDDDRVAEKDDTTTPAISLLPKSPEEVRIASLVPAWSRLLEEVVVVQYSEQRDAATIVSDSGKNKPTGLKGLACRHCSYQQQQQQLHAGAVIFPQDRRSLARDFETKLYQHVVSECEACPAETKDELSALYRDRAEAFVLDDTTVTTTNATTRTTSSSAVSHEERLFFKHLWYRMGHKDMQSWKVGH